jgi:Glu-tRNA(Gln) amidotransferase subunit E-like FAD-binding protein
MKEEGKTDYKENQGFSSTRNKDVSSYQKIGLKAGLEIHQQLDTGKLFCNCPGYLRSEKPDFEVHRKLHAVAGELGEIDPAVLHEMEKGKEFVYQGYKDNTCLVELDESPPYLINENALDEALKVALLLNCEIYQTTQVMRKTVIDGSNTSGFQRTLLLAHDGYVETSFGKVGIQSICLEEDAARIVEKGEKHVVFKLDRLGIPLVEIATKPELYTPEQIKECALKLGEMIRACRVKRGIGTIRQDLNISIKGHDRVEIKGFQEPKMMIETVEKEIARQQQDLKKKKKEGEVRGAKEDGTSEFLRPMPGEARMYPETDLPLLKIHRDRINELKKKLPKMKHDIRDELRKQGLNEEMIGLILSEHYYLDQFQTLMKVYDKDANLIAKMLTLWRQELATKYNKLLGDVHRILHERVLESILEKVADGTIKEDDVRTVMIRIIEGKPFVEAIKIERISDDELEKKIADIVKEKPGLRANAYMGMVIAKLGASVDKRKAMEILNRIVK